MKPSLRAFVIVSLWLFWQFVWNISFKEIKLCLSKKKKKKG